MDVNNYQNMLRKSCKSVMRHCVVRLALPNAKPRAVGDIEPDRCRWMLTHTRIVGDALPFAHMGKVARKASARLPCDI